MTNIEIIKAAEKCINGGICEKCPYANSRGCRGLTADLLKLIKKETKEMGITEFKEAVPMEEAEEDKCITRKEAATVLWELANSFIVSNEMAETLEDIATNLEAESIGYHFWGAEREEKDKIFTAMQSESITPEFEEECERIDEKYSFIPSEFEKVEIENNICGYDDDDEEY